MPAWSEERRRIKRLYQRCRGLGIPVVVAFSGGNDSASCLIHLSKSAVPSVALLVDNGFISDPVIERAHSLCRRLDVPFFIESFSLLELVGRDVVSPCETCIAEVLARAGRFALARGAAAVATGHLYGPAFGTIEVGAGRILRFAPLLTSRMTERDRNALLESSKWPTLPRYGSSSNCVLLGYIEYHYFKRWGYSPAVGEISHELRAGTLDLSGAKAKLAHALVWCPEYANVERMLGK